MDICGHFCDILDIIKPAGVEFVMIEIDIVIALRFVCILIRFDLFEDTVRKS